MGGGSTGRRIVVLVVEDEPILRMLAVDMAEDAGFETIEAADAEMALAILGTRDDVDVVFTDVDMPGGMDGAKLAHAIHRRWPPIRLIVTSGYYRMSELDLPKGDAFFSKPYRPAEVVAEMRRSLG